MVFEYNRAGLYTQETIEMLKKDFPSGTNIKLIQMADGTCPVPPGTMGVVVGVDAGGVLMQWNGNGSSLKLLPEIDKYEILQQITEERRVKSYGDN